ncbi:MAG: hypothetical protein KA713_05075 [Chryseotalea sp. WA131a]|nr:MAG: hypothetical protein KA713_05075 [Chryseotalea sp. WA131a]
MDKLLLTQISELLGRSNQAGLKILYDDSGLSLKYPKGKVIDPGILDELRLHKQNVIEYLKNMKSEKDFSELHSDWSIPKVVRNGRDYYAVTPVQNYWLDDSLDAEFKNEDNIHGSVIQNYEILGDFDVTTFNKSIAYLVQRHESLRTTFHKLDDSYFLRVEDESFYTSEYFDLSGMAEGDEKIVQLSRFADHKFDLENGPIFLVRLIQLKVKKYILSFKFHHVVFDTMSDEIFLRDLYVSYIAFAKNLLPNLPALRYQYKENLALINYQVELHGRSQWVYWNSTFPKLPTKRVPIRGIRSLKRKMSDRISKCEQFEFSTDASRKLRALTIDFSTSLFVILQATFKSFVFSSTRVNDILIRTDVFGRDFQSCNNQIGCYAKGVFVRTVFDEDESFATAIPRVKKANEDMQEHRALTLMQFLHEKLLAEGNPSDTFWAIQYEDTDRSSYSRSDLSRMPLPVDFTVSAIEGPSNILIPIDINLKFINTANNIRLRVDYDSSVLDKTAITNFIGEYLSHIKRVLKEKQRPLIGI